MSARKAVVVNSFQGVQQVPKPIERPDTLKLRVMQMGQQLQGIWTFDWFRHLLDTLEGIHYDCFPSGHTEQTLLAWCMSIRLSRRFFVGFTIFTASQIFSTVYLRYHYVVDLFAGALIAAVLILVAPSVYKSLKRLVV